MSAAGMGMLKILCRFTVSSIEQISFLRLPHVQPAWWL